MPFIIFTLTAGQQCAINPDAVGNITPHESKDGKPTCRLWERGGDSWWQVFGTLAEVLEKLNGAPCFERQPRPNLPLDG